MGLCRRLHDRKAYAVAPFVGARRICLEEAVEELGVRTGSEPFRLVCDQDLSMAREGPLHGECD